MDIQWSEGTWTNRPAGVRDEAGAMIIEAVEGSDAWRETSYGFVHDTEHGLLRAWPDGSAMEVDVVAEFTQQFDQAGLFIRADAEHWVKAGVEFSDGVLQLGAVVTWPKSDWSVAPVDGWNGRVITVRASRSGDAVTLRARVDRGHWQFVRVFPIPQGAELAAGPMVCAPTRAGLQVRFTGWRLVDADAGLH